METNANVDLNLVNILFTIIYMQCQKVRTPWQTRRAEYIEYRERVQPWLCRASNIHDHTELPLGGHGYCIDHLGWSFSAHLKCDVIHAGLFMLREQFAIMTKIEFTMVSSPCLD